MLHSKQKVNRKITNVGLTANKRAYALWERSDREPKGSKAKPQKKSNEGVDFGAKRSETLIYIYFIYMFNNIFSTSESLRAPRVSEVYE